VKKLGWLRLNERGNTMLKKNFIALADALRGVKMSKEMLIALAVFCKSQNPKFNRDRWLGYLTGKCGPNGGKI